MVLVWLYSDDYFKYKYDYIPYGAEWMLERVTWFGSILFEKFYEWGFLDGRYFSE